MAREAGGRAHEVALHAARRRVEHGEATGAQQLLERLAAANDAEATELLLTRRGWELVEAAAAANHAAAAQQHPLSAQLHQSPFSIES